MKLVFDGDHYSEIVESRILKARSRVWIATANVKDLHIPRSGGRRGMRQIGMLY